MEQPFVDRADGYVTEIGYNYLYHYRTNPLFLRLRLLMAGIVPPTTRTACDLGFGQGVSLAFHAAASPVRWIGNDFLPDHVAHARSLVDAAGATADLFTDSFVDLAARDDLPELDYIVAHGLWSWISERNRAAILDFVTRRLKPGGVLYLSYNALPGQAIREPVRYLAVEIARRSPAGANITDRMAAAIDMLGCVLAADPAYGKDAPLIGETLQEMKEANPAYRAHEYFNRHWRSMHFAEVAAQLADAGLSWVGPARYDDLLESLDLTTAQRAIVDGTADPILRETLRDFLINRRFRNDVWVKAPTIDRAGAERCLRTEHFVRIDPRASLSLQVRGALAFNGHDSLVRAMEALLAALPIGPARTLDDLSAAVGDGVTLALLTEAIAFLRNADMIAAAQSPAQVEATSPVTRRLNALLLQEAAAGRGFRHLASPVLGGGVLVPFEEQAALRAGALTGPRLELLRALEVV